ncbi:MAG: sigma-70 family RNA polymerase sigma factor [Muribaculaceae bacterium]|nr:sigma-70 family RNA polymerase sigma factor [Muribaculaceae bacterium]
MTTDEFKAKVLPHYKCMYRVAASVTRSETEAADVVQDALLRLYERRNLLNDVADIKSYCVNAVRNDCLNRIRSKKDYVSTEAADDMDSGENIHAALEWKDLSGIVDRAMNHLQTDQLEVFKLSAFGGFSNAEIADMLGISQGNVRVLLCRARNKIRELLSKNQTYGRG